MPALAKLKMPAPKSKEKDPMLEMDMEELDESAPEEMMEEYKEPKESEPVDLSVASDDELSAELEARGFSVQKSEAAAEKPESDEESEIDFSV